MKCRVDEREVNPKTGLPVWLLCGEVSAIITNIKTLNI